MSIELAPIQFGIDECPFIAWIANRRLYGLRRIRLKLAEEFASALMHEPAQLVAVIRKKHETIRREKFLAHEQQWRWRAEQQQCRGCAIATRTDVGMHPIADARVAHLIVVLQEVHARVSRYAS